MPKIRFVAVWRGWEPGQEYDCEDWFAKARIEDGTAKLASDFGLEKDSAKAELKKAKK